MLRRRAYKAGGSCRDVSLSGPGVSVLRSCSCIYKETVILCEIPEVQSLIWKESRTIIKRSVMTSRIFGRAEVLSRRCLNLSHIVDWATDHGGALSAEQRRPRPGAASAAISPGLFHATNEVPDLRISHIAYDRDHSCAEDMNCWFPLAQMTIGRWRNRPAAARFHGLPTNRSQKQH